MQTDILLKQLHSSLSDLKTAIDKFEKHPSPSTQYAEQLYAAIALTNKLVSAYLVLKEKKDVAPDLDLHIKLMAVPNPDEKKAVVDIEPVQEMKSVETKIEAPAETVKIEPVLEAKPLVNETVLEAKIIATDPVVQINTQTKTYPKLAININDKFRFINELFKTNANEYNMAIDQLNELNSWEDTRAYLNGLKSIYSWDDENEMVKKLAALSQKRFS